MSDNKKVVVFGSTGAIGTHLVNILAKEQPSWEITAVTRSTTDRFASQSNVKVAQGDALKKEDTMKLSADKDIVYCCIGFPQYERKYWAVHWPIVMENMLAASSQTKHQKFVFCDNLYAYGAITGVNTKSTLVPASNKSKPAVRSLIRQSLQKRMDENPGSITVVGGADFFGPLATSISFLGDTFTKAIVEGKPAPICIASKDAVHDFCYAPDFSRALYVASVSPKAYGYFWICPHTVHGKNFTDLALDIGKIAGSQNTKVTCYPAWSIRLLSPFVGFMGEMVEMLPFWKQDYTVDDSEFCKTFNEQATPYDEALRGLVEFYKKE